MNVSADPEELKHLILNWQEPLIFKNKLNWPLLSWTLEEWKSLLGEEELQFRSGANSYTKEPQWERTTGHFNMPFDQFVSFCEKPDPERWMYFDYKYLRDHLVGIKHLKESISWSEFGFPNLTSDDSTLWIGSKGAHTPCHIDTYGCNLIAQIYGRKQWLVFPPEEDMLPTRIPYEESSIYSKLNFFSPRLGEFEGIHNCRRVILEPGDVLFLPQKWWHYVENLETAISVNVWLPMPDDDIERLKESLVQFLMSRLLIDVDVTTKRDILNPNSDSNIEDMNLNDAVNTINFCKNRLSNLNKRRRRLDDVPKKDHKQRNALEIIDKLDFVQQVPKMSHNDFKELIQDQVSRFGSSGIENIGSQKIANNSDTAVDIAKLINAITHPEVIELIEQKL